MQIETSKAIELFFPNPSLMSVYFEALANALDAGATEISIIIKIDAFTAPETLRIIISDNGSGFNDENFDRFKTVLNARDKYHKGTGRLVFLRYFSQVEVISVWSDNKRHFIFKDKFDNNIPIKKLKNIQPNKTELIFSSFNNDRVKSYNHLEPKELKQQIIEHFFPTFQRLKRENKHFQIAISLSTHQVKEQKNFFTNETTITPNDLPVMETVIIQSKSMEEQLRIVDVNADICMRYYIQPAEVKAKQMVAFSVDGRTIPAKFFPQSACPQDHSCFFFFKSDMFDSNSDNSRQELNLPSDISKDKFYAILRREIGKILVKHIPEIEKKNIETQKNLEDTFPHLGGYFENDTVGIIDRDDSLSFAQQRFFVAQKEVLQSKHISEPIYEKSLELSSRTLTEYILYRDKIIRKLKETTANDSEAYIHNLIVPKQRIFEHHSINSELYQNNAWLLDDKFMVFRTILSEQRMSNVINAIKLDDEQYDEQGRPDIAMIFSADPDSPEPVDVVVVEIKKKTDNEKDNQYAINQLLARAEKLVAYCPKIQRIWYYAVIQISETLATRLTQQRWSPLFSRGKVFYNDMITPSQTGKPVPTPTFAISFDAIVADAEARNHAFLEILKAGIRKYGEMKNSSENTTQNNE